MPRKGGRLPGSGAPKGNANAAKPFGGRDWARKLADRERPHVEAAVEKLRNLALSEEAGAEQVRSYIDTVDRCFYQAGYGRPPQALDVKLGGDQDAPIQHEVRLPGGLALPPGVTRRAS